MTAVFHFYRQRKVSRFLQPTWNAFVLARRVKERRVATTGSEADGGEW